MDCSNGVFSSINRLRWTVKIMLSLLSNFWSRTIRTKAQLPWLSARTTLFMCSWLLAHRRQTAKKKVKDHPNLLPVLASAPLHTQDTKIGLGALVWQPQPSFSISDRSCLMAEKSRQNASRIARQKMKTGCERHGERESERRREDRATKLGRTRKTIRCYQSEQQDMVRAEQTG